MSLQLRKGHASERQRVAVSIGNDYSLRTVAGVMRQNIRNACKDGFIELNIVVVHVKIRDCIRSKVGSEQEVVGSTPACKSIAAPTYKHVRIGSPINTSWPAEPSSTFGWTPLLTKVVFAPL